MHNRTAHSMRGFPQNWRGDRGLTERVCPHGVGHPDPDHMAWFVGKFGEKAAIVESIHGCDGCCKGQMAEDTEINDPLLGE